MADARHEYINARAYELAASGQHIDCITIVSALVAEGYPEASEILNSDLIRSDLRRVCAQHWQGVKPEYAEPAVPAQPEGAEAQRAGSEAPTAQDHT